MPVLFTDHETKKLFALETTPKGWSNYYLVTPKGWSNYYLVTPKGWSNYYLLLIIGPVFSFFLLVMSVRIQTTRAPGREDLV